MTDRLHAGEQTPPDQRTPEQIAWIEARDLMLRHGMPFGDTGQAHFAAQIIAALRAEGWREPE